MTDVPPLQEIQQWERGDWEQYDPCLWGGEPSTTRVLKTIIRAADRELRWRGAENANSLRDFWYNPCKPILQRAFPAKVDDPDCDFNRRMSQDLSRVLSELVKDGGISYRSLNILDESRERVINTRSPDDDKILFVEKEAAYRKLRPLEKVYELSVVSGGGWQATALIEDLTHELPAEREYTVYLLTDFDPTGWKIGDDFRARAERLGLKIAEVRRVGVRPDQLAPETVHRQRFAPAVDSDADREWMDEHGIEGQYGLEIEALGDLQTKGRDLRELVVAELREDIRVREHMKQTAESVTEAAVNRAVNGIIQNVVDDLQTELLATAAETLDTEHGVSAQKRGSGVDAEIELETVTAAWLPDPYDPDDLHRAAVAGDRPTPKCGETPAAEVVARRLRREVRQQVNVAELVTGINSGGGGA